MSVYIYMHICTYIGALLFRLLARRATAAIEFVVSLPRARPLPCLHRPDLIISMFIIMMYVYIYIYTYIHICTYVYLCIHMY